MSPSLDSSGARFYLYRRRFPNNRLWIGPPANKIVPGIPNLLWAVFPLKKGQEFAPARSVTETGMSNVRTAYLQGKKA